MRTTNPSSGLKETVENAVRAWVTPALILITGYLVKDKLDSIENELKTVRAVRETQIQMEVRLNNLETFYRGSTERNPAKHEDPVTFKTSQ